LHKALGGAPRHAALDAGLRKRLKNPALMTTVAAHLVGWGGAERIGFVLDAVDEAIGTTPPEDTRPYGGYLSTLLRCFNTGEAAQRQRAVDLAVRILAQTPNAGLRHAWVKDTLAKAGVAELRKHEAFIESLAADDHKPLASQAGALLVKLRKARDDQAKKETSW
jgi:hypothetical protein